MWKAHPIWGCSLSAMLQILIFSFWRKLKCKSTKCIPPPAAKTVAWVQHLFLHYLFTYSDTLTYSLSASCRPTYCQHAIKMASLGTINNWLLNFFPYQHFFKFFGHIKRKNTKPFFFAVSNSSLFNFVP